MTQKRRLTRVRATADTTPTAIIEVPAGMGAQHEQAFLAALEAHQEASGESEHGGGWGMLVQRGNEDLVGELTAIHDRQAFLAAKVEQSQETLRWLVRIYQQRVLTRERNEDLLEGWSDGTSLSMLAAAQLCDVDSESIRLTDAGERLVDELALAGA